jgi:hypothetical protein
MKPGFWDKIMNRMKEDESSYKIFCIGRNKTGTKSLTKALSDLGLRIAPQRPAELLIEDWSKRDFRKLIDFCKESGCRVFADNPFSLPYTFQAMDAAFPGSKFIITVRDDPEQWYSSIVNYHSKLFGKGQVPSKDQLMNAEYVCKGWMWNLNQWVYGTHEDDPYNQELLISHYILHNETVLRYFSKRSRDLLVLNPSDPDAIRKLCGFLDLGFKESLKFPWINRNDRD